jgi:L-ascorbate metabolism protein UlaG (beta-lactamase superfamily)
VGPSTTNLGVVRLRKFGHACVRLDTAEGAVVIDPGNFSPVADLEGAADVLVTHEHAEIYEGLPGCANVGFFLGGVYHPGDALHVPEVEVETLLVPVSAPWLKLAEVLDFVRAVGPARAFPIHDALFNDVGNAGADRWLDMKAQTDYRRLTPSESVDL